MRGLSVSRMAVLAVLMSAGLVGGCDESLLGNSGNTYDPRVDGITPRSEVVVSKTILDAPAARPAAPAGAATRPAGAPAVERPAAPAEPG